MSASFAIEDPMSRASQELRDQGMKGQAKHMFKEMARNMWSSGKGFAKVGALYSGTECCIEAVSVPSLPYKLLPGRKLTTSTVRRTTSGTLSLVVSSRVLSSRATPVRRLWSAVVSRSPVSRPRSTSGSARRPLRSLKRPPLYRSEYKTRPGSRARPGHTHEPPESRVLDLDYPLLSISSPLRQEAGWSGPGSQSYFVVLMHRIALARRVQVWQTCVPGANAN